MKLLKNTLRIDPHVPLQAVPLFWLSIILPALASIILLALALPDIGPVCFSPACYSSFLSELQLPIGVLSLSLVFGVMIGRFHGSAQRLASYKQSEVNNTLKNYFDHRKYFSEWYTTLHNKRVEQLRYIELTSPARLYGALFQENSPSHVSTELSRTQARAAFRDIQSSMVSAFNFMLTRAQQEMEASTEQLSPQDCVRHIESAISSINSMTIRYGVAIKQLKDWPRPPYSHSEAVTILTEVSAILELAYEFSSNLHTPSLAPSEQLLSLESSCDFQGFISLALTFGFDDTSNNS